MYFNIGKERIKLIQVINDDTFNYSKYVKENEIQYIKPEPHIRFLWIVLTLTIKCPQVELYLKNLLNYFTVDELEEISDGCSFLYQMVRQSYKISVNAFEIIISHGININVESVYGYTSVHRLMLERHSNHNNNILNLLIKYGANLNIRDRSNRTVLDFVTCFVEKLDEETKNCIMMLVDFGAKTNYPQKNVIHDFIEYYKNSIIKPAIKNEK